MQDTHINIAALTKRLIEFRDARDWRQFHSLKDLILSLNLEASELLELAQWQKEDDFETAMREPAKKEALGEECADILLYLLLIAERSDIDLLKAASAKIDKNEARVAWTLSATAVDRLIRGLSPFPGAWCEVDGERVKLLRSRVVEGSGIPGQVLDGFTIACGSGAVEIMQAQRPGKRPMQAKDVLRGLKLPERVH